MSHWKVNVTDETFESEIVERSKDVPIVVDFWAEWCAPCRALGPLLEKLADEYDGKFVLAKVDTEKAPNASAQFQIQSIPAVFAIRDGKIVDGFMGALPEPQLREWLDRFLPSDAEVLVAEAKALSESNIAEAESKLRNAIELDPRLDAAKIELADVLLKAGKLDESGEIIEQLEARGFLEPEAERVKAALEIKQAGAESGGVDTCREKLAADPGNLTLKTELAEALASAGQHEEALQIALSVVQASTGDDRERARHAMVDIFKILPPDSELASEYRRKLSMALF
ncbi:MAG: thioredoxin [Planctomycetales bacterium]|nr:thioredoxin [Planctomycetales bacterium]